MKDYWAMYHEIANQMYECGIEIGDIEEIKINSRAKSRWGRCSYNRLRDSYTIEISDRLVADNVDDMALANTLAHEMLHTAKGCMNHGVEWKRLADIMNAEYGYNIQRTTSAKEKGIEETESTRKEETYHYIIHCENCGTNWKYMRYCRIVRSCEKNMAKCSCGGKNFYVEKI